MNDNLIYMGVNATREHQIVIAKLVYRLYGLYEKKQISLLPIPEAMINQAETSPVPDVMLVNEQELTEVIIEVNHTVGVKKDAEKLQTLMSDYEVKEGFVYDYKTQNWQKYTLDMGKDELNPSFSNILQIDLKNLLK